MEDKVNLLMMDGEISPYALGMIVEHSIVNIVSNTVARTIKESAYSIPVLSYTLSPTLFRNYIEELVSIAGMDAERVAYHIDNTEDIITVIFDCRVEVLLRETTSKEILATIQEYFN